MRWVAPPEKDQGTETLESRLWAAADQLRANSGLSAAQYSQPGLRLIFLRFAEARLSARREALDSEATGSRRDSRLEAAAAHHAEGVLYLEPAARFDHLLNLPEGPGLGEAVNAAMRAIERENPQLAGALPKRFEAVTSTLLKELLKKVSENDITSDQDTATPVLVVPHAELLDGGPHGSVSRG